MFAKLSLAAGLVLAAAMLVPAGASAAAPQSPLPGVSIEGSLVQKAQVGLLPRLAPRVRRTLGLAHARPLPLHGPARLLNG